MAGILRHPPGKWVVLALAADDQRPQDARALASVVCDVVEDRRVLCDLVIRAEGS